MEEEKAAAVDSLQLREKKNERTGL